MFEINLSHSLIEPYTATKLLFMLGVRKNELLKATWSEFDLNNAVWTLPAERCKNKKSIFNICYF